MKTIHIKIVLSKEEIFVNLYPGTCQAITNMYYNIEEEIKLNSCQQLCLWIYFCSSTSLVMEAWIIILGCTTGKICRFANNISTIANLATYNFR